jgi:hypothetical protein
MTNQLTPQPTPDDDDGFHRSSGSTRLIRGTLIKWDATQHWQDRDGLPPPEQLLVIRLNEALQMWRDGKPTVITDKPLPDPDDLNAAIPVSEWEKGMDDRPQPPWQHVVILYAIDPRFGAFYTFVSGTIGAHMAIDALRESVEGKRILSRAQVTPIIKLGERPMKTRFGMKTRPHFEICGWETPDALPPATAPRQIAAPTSEPTPEPAPTAPARPPGKMTITSGKAKPPVKLAVADDGLGDVKPDPRDPSDSLDDLPFA